MTAADALARCCSGKLRHGFHRCQRVSTIIIIENTKIAFVRVVLSYKRPCEPRFYGCAVPFLTTSSNSNAAHTCERLHSDKSRATMDAMLHRQRLLVQRPSMLGLVQPRQATPLRRLPAYCRSCASLPTPPVPVTQIHAIDPEA